MRPFRSARPFQDESANPIETPGNPRPSQDELPKSNNLATLTDSENLRSSILDDLAVETSAPMVGVSTIDPCLNIGPIVRLERLADTAFLSGSKFFSGVSEDTELSDSEDTLKDMSDAGSVASGLATEGRLRYKRKRASVLDMSTNSKKKPKAKAKHSQGHSSTVGEFIEMAEAKTKLATAERAAAEGDLAAMFEAREASVRQNRAQYGYGVSPVLNYRAMSVADLEEAAKEDSELVILIATKSRNLKGTFVKALKDRSLSHLAISAELARRSTSSATEETAALQAMIRRLTGELAESGAELVRLRAELSGLTSEPVARPASQTTLPPAPSQTKDLVAQFEAVLEARLKKHTQEERFFTRSVLAAYEPRLNPEERVRPPLASDRRPAVPTPTPAPSAAFKPPPPPPSSKGKGVGKKTWAWVANSTATELMDTAVPTLTPVASTSATGTDVLLPSTTPANEGWTTVARKKAPKPKLTQPASASTTSGASKKRRKKVKVAAASTAFQPSSALVAKKPSKRKLVVPDTSAVVVTLTAEALEKGMTYDAVMRSARNVIGGEASEVSRYRITAAGARLFEFPAADNGARATAFAAKMREAVVGVAKVAQPVKCITLVVADLDETVTKEEVTTKVASVGDCRVEDIKAGALRTGRGGLGTLRLQVPIAAANVVLGGGRLRVGWSSASVRALEEEPLRCFRCLGTGHTRTTCTSAVDRGELCFRCGKEGHKAAGCKAMPNCAVCAASGRPAGHVMRGTKCNPPPNKGKRLATVRPASAAPAGALSSAVQDEAMSD